MILELHVADVVDDHKIKMDAMCLKIRKIRKYAIHRGLVSLCRWINCYLNCDLHHICCDEGKFSLVFCFTNGYLAYFPPKWHNYLSQIKNELYLAYSVHL